jgi:hypothetical protein
MRRYAPNGEDNQTAKDETKKRFETTCVHSVLFPCPGKMGFINPAIRGKIIAQSLAKQAHRFFFIRWQKDLLFFGPVALWENKI